MAEEYTRATELEQFQRIAEGLGGERYKEYDIAPFVEMVEATIPEEIWSGVFYSWQSMKGFLQGVYGMERVQMFAARERDGHIFACFCTVWAGGEELAEWLENGYPVEEMLTGMGVPKDNITMRLVRDYS